MQALRLPEAYPHRPDGIDFQQTQMSLLFLAGDYVYKVKKPVNLGYLDYSSLEARHAFCEKEVRLNRRLCEPAYLDVVPVVRCRNGFCVEADGAPVDYAVKMLRLPAERMLDYLLANNAATTAMMQRIARRVADFHQAAGRSDEISSFGQRSVIRGNTDENFEQTLSYIGRTITKPTHTTIRRYTDDFINRNESLFGTRIEEGRIVDCHGDLHAAHVCMTDDICIYDCIEFNDRFRYGDVASEVAFLAMDLDRYSRRDLSDRFVREYEGITRDSGVPALLDFYKCYRAFVRGKVEGFRSTDRMASDEERDDATWRARRYFQLAKGYATARGTLVVMSGLSGSGKSAVAGELADKLGCAVITSDVVRKELAGLSPSEKRSEPYGQGLYSEDWTRRTYEEMMRRGAAALAQGQCVLLDASFLLRWQRDMVLAMAQGARVRPILAECTASYATLVDRLARRTSISDARPEILDGQLASREAVTETGDYTHIVLDTEQPTTGTVEELWKHL